MERLAFVVSRSPGRGSDSSLVLGIPSIGDPPAYSSSLSYVAIVTTYSQVAQSAGLDSYKQLYGRCSAQVKRFFYGGP